MLHIHGADLQFQRRCFANETTAASRHSRMCFVVSTQSMAIRKTALVFARVRVVCRFCVFGSMACDEI